MLTRRFTAILFVLVIVPIFLGGSALVPQEDWEDAVCEEYGCFNSTELHCATATGKRKIVIMVLLWEIVISEEEYTIECTQGWP